MTEIEAFNKLVSKNPNKGIPTELRRISNSTKTKRSDSVVVPSWMTDSDKDEIIGLNSFLKLIKQLGYTTQIIYDVIILGLTDISQRPKCRNSGCVNSVKFINLSLGYGRYCSRRCTYMDNFDARNSPESKLKKRSKLLGRKLSKPRSEEYRRKMSESRKGSKRSKEAIEKFRKTLALNKLNGKVRKPMSRESIEKAKATKKLNGYKPSKESIAKGLATKERNKLIAESKGLPYNKRNPNSKTRKGQKVSEESRERMRIAQQKKDKSVYHSKEFRKKQSESSKRYFEENPDKLREFILNGKFGSKKGKIHVLKYNKKKDFYYMSSWEKYYVLEFDNDDDVKVIFSPDPIGYVCPYKLSEKLYLPDIGIITEDNSVIIIEVKPIEYINDPVVIAKRLAGINYCKRFGYTYVTLTENEMTMNNLTIDYILNVVKTKYYDY